MAKKKNFVFLLSRDDSNQKLIAFDIETIILTLQNEIENEDKDELLGLSYEVSFKQMSDKELDDLGEGEFDGF